MKEKHFKLLSDFTKDDVGIVEKVEGQGYIRRRIFDMGITPGAVISYTKSAPLGDPIQVNVRGYELTLRKKEASLVTMQLVGGQS